MGKGRGHGQSDVNASPSFDDAVLQREDSVMFAKDRLGHANDSITVAKGREIQQIVDETIRNNNQPVIISEASQQRSTGTSAPEDVQDAASRNQTGAADPNRLMGFMKSCANEEVTGNGSGEPSVRKSSVVHFSEDADKKGKEGGSER